MNVETLPYPPVDHIGTVRPELGGPERKRAWSTYLHALVDAGYWSWSSDAARVKAQQVNTPEANRTRLNQIRATEEREGGSYMPDNRGFL